jgi:hypothetical protein
MARMKTSPFAVNAEVTLLAPGKSLVEQRRDK